MPVYEYRCAPCERDLELLQPLGADPPVCAGCGEPMRRRYSRAAVRYGTWGFKSTDGLISAPGKKDFKALRERAERISEEGV
jgi:putative FmdB family regulatory protein